MAEAVGFVLAVLPLVVNQLDAYVQGIETLKLLRSRRYGFQMKSWKLDLGSEQAILNNNIELLLSADGSEEGVAEFLMNLQEQQYIDNGPIFERLHELLGRNYDVYVANMTELSKLLQQLKQKLGLSPGSAERVSKDVSIFKQELKKCKDIFSKSVYESLLGKIKAVNSTLGILTDQSLHFQEAKRKPKPQKGFSIYQTVRKHARSLHNAVIGSQSWECSCKNQHFVNLHLQPRAFGRHDHSNSAPLMPRFRLTLFSRLTDTVTNVKWNWQEVDIESVETVAINASRKVQFADVMTTKANQNWQSIGQPILDICSTLAAVRIDCRQEECIGFLLDQFDKQRHHRIYPIRTQTRELQTRSLEDILSAVPPTVATRRVEGHVSLRPKERLYIAATLASSVFQLHGSWLKSQWRTCDILFPKDESLSQALIHLYLSWSVSSNNGDLKDVIHMSSTDHPLIRSRVLLPLGLALVEVSLGQRLADLRLPIDDHPVEAVANLTTATRLLDAGEVVAWSGPRYHDVVKSCLFWSGVQDGELNDENFQRAVFESIVSPLLDNLKDFEGEGQIS